MPLAKDKYGRTKVVSIIADSLVPCTNIKEYIEHPPKLERLIQDADLAFTSFLDLDEQLKELDSQNRKLLSANQELGLKLKELQDRSLPIFGLSLLGTILFGIGGNVVVSTPYQWTGWIMLFAFLVIECVVFLLTDISRIRTQT